MAFGLSMAPFAMKNPRMTAKSRSLSCLPGHFLPLPCKMKKENYMRFSHGCQAVVSAQYLARRG
ncbi:hypothetical protein NKJ16_30900 [Mesorhizobium sp. M0179]|uniref:hypothetical protein n=1 Tax=unclassified Mesorhizobium TaxID=325217 RepID=UPI000429AAED|nr:hypothetical protein [Mesorhizobium sp. LSJC265A00]